MNSEMLCEVRVVPPEKAEKCCALCSLSGIFKANAQ